MPVFLIFMAVGTVFGIGGTSVISRALFGVFYVLCNTLQAMGAATPALIVNLSRQGIIYIPAVFIMQVFFGITGLAWAQPIADLLSLLLVAVLYVYTIRRMESKTKARAVEASFFWN